MSKRRQCFTNDQNVSVKPVLQDFTINSLSEISSGVLTPSDSTIFEEIKGFDVALPSVTLNNTEDIDLSSGPYPPDSTMIDVSKAATHSQEFKKPFFNRQKAKPRHSLFDLDGEDCTQDTPEQEIRHPFKRKSKKPLNSTLFDFESSNENINNSNVISNFIARRALRSKKNVDNSLFDKALETSESDISVSNKPVLRISKKKSKKVNASVFEDAFDDSLNLSNVDNSITSNQKQCFNNLKNKQKHVDSAIFDSVFNSSASPDKSNNSILEKDKEESISAFANISENSCENTLISENCETSDQTENKNAYFNSDTSITSEYECEETSNELVDETNFKAKHQNISGNKTQTKNIAINQIMPTNEEGEINMSYSDQFKKQLSAKEFSTYCDTDQDNTELLYGRERDIKERNSCGIIGTIVTQEKTDEDNYMKIVPEEILLPIHEATLTKADIEANNILQKESSLGTQEITDKDNSMTTVSEESLLPIHEATLTKADIEANDIVQKEGLLGTQEITDEDNCIKIVSEECLLPIHEATLTKADIEANVIVQKEGSLGTQDITDKDNCMTTVSEESVLPIHEAILTKADIEANVIVQKESSLGTQESTDRVKYLKKLSEESILSTNNKETKTSQIQKERRVSFMLDDNQLNKRVSLNKQKSGRKSTLINNSCNSGKLSTPIIKQTNMSKSAYSLDSLVFKEESENHASGSAFLDLHASQLNKRVSLNKRKSGRKSTLIENGSYSNSGKLSTSIIKQNNMSKSAFSLDSLVFEEESENRASGSAFLDLHATKSATGSLNSNSAFSQQSKPSINSSQQDHSHLNSRSSNNDYGSKDISGVEYEQSSVMDEKEETSEDSSEMEDGYVDSSLIVENKLDESTASGKVEEQIEEDSLYEEDEEEQVEEGNVEVSEGESLVEKKDEEDEFSLIEEHTLQCEEENSSHDEDEEEHVEGEDVEGSEGKSFDDRENEGSLIEEHTSQCEEENSSRNEDDEEHVEGENVEESQGESLVEQENDYEGPLIEERTLESVEEEEFSESMDSEEEPNQVENISYGEEERKEDNSEMKSLDKNSRLIKECIAKNKNPDYQTSNNPLKENKKKGTDLQQLFKNPLPKKPINKRKIQEILNNIPLSELKKKKRRVCTELEKSNSSQSREQMLQDEIEEALLKNRKTTQVGFTKANKLKIPRKWVTPKMYNFIISKLQPTFGLRARVKAENVVLLLVELTDSVMKREQNYFDVVEEIKAELAGLEIVHSHWDFYKFATQFFDGSFIWKVFHSEVVNPFVPKDPTESIL